MKRKKKWIDARPFNHPDLGLLEVGKTVIYKGITMRCIKSNQDTWWLIKV